MIQIIQGQQTTVKVRLNEVSLSGLDIHLSLYSPSRGTILLSKSLTKISRGYYYFDISEAEADELVDDTYFYTVIQGLNTLKTGVIMLTLSEAILGGFNYTLDITLA
tara:strand:+ start:2347 stop:2667 length:321 start_codon:yes stop_codon:yes gene_type:complete